VFVEGDGMIVHSQLVQFLFLSVLLILHLIQVGITTAVLMRDNNSLLHHHHYHINIRMVNKRIEKWLPIINVHDMSTNLDEQFLLAKWDHQMVIKMMAR
jgi:hypothetical protein